MDALAAHESSDAVVLEFLRDTLRYGEGVLADAANGRHVERLHDLSAYLLSIHREIECE
jgi:hypothetical protein